MKFKPKQNKAIPCLAINNLRGETRKKTKESYTQNKKQSFSQEAHFLIREIRSLPRRKLDLPQDEDKAGEHM